MTDKKKIRELIEKRYEYWKEKEFNSHSIESEIRMSECQHLLLMINSLQEEPVSEELEEAAMQYGIDEFPSLCNGCKHIPIDAFKAGAEWQEKQDQETIELAEDHAMLAGMNIMEQQMMTKAVDGIARPYDNEIWCNLASSNLKDGDEVKVIIIKEG